MNLTDMKLYLFSGRAAYGPERNMYEKCYQMWKTIWQQTFLELKGHKEIFSDAFTRQDKICALFRDQECIAVAGLRSYEFSVQSSNDDSIFSSWDKESFETLTKNGPRVLVCSNLAVHPDFRGEVLPGFSLKNLITYFSVKELLVSDCDAMAGTARCNRGANKAAYANGAHFIKRAQMHGVEVDLVAFYKTELENKLLHSTSNFIWDNRIDLTEAVPDRRLKVA